jgi:peptide/nickel transport system substrate-binding protein
MTRQAAGPCGHALRDARRPAAGHLRALLLSALLLAAPACSGPEASLPPAAETLRVVLRSDPATLDPLVSNTTVSATVAAQILEPLVDLDASLRPVPRLAVEWAREQGGKAWRFRLRSGVRWQGGGELAPADVAATLARALDPGTPSLGFRSLFAGAGAVEIPGPLVVRVPFGPPSPISLFSWRQLPILPEAASRDPQQFARHPRGSGPYRLLAWRPQEWILLERNDDWWAGAPPIRYLLFRIIPDALTASRALQLGEVDIAPVRYADQARARQGRAPFRILEYDPLIVYVVVWNLRPADTLFADARVRRALTLAFNRQAFADKVRRGTARPAATLYPPLWRRGREGPPPLPFDPREAARLLEAAGWGERDGEGWRVRAGRRLSFPLLYAGEDEVRRDAALMLESDQARIGVQVRLERVAPLELVRRMRGHDFEAAVHGWKLDAEPKGYEFLHSSQAAGGLNYGGYADPQLDHLLELEAGAREEGDRSLAGLQVELRLRERAPLLFICFPIGLLGVNSRVQGLEVGPLGPLIGYPGAAGLRLTGPATGRDG